MVPRRPGGGRTRFAVTPELKQLADEITAGLATDEDKVAALNHWAAENIRYVGLHMGTGEGYTLHPAAMTLRDRGGVCKDKAGILVALLRAAGYESYPAMTMAGERIENIAADQFNHCVTVWRKPDKTTRAPRPDLDPRRARDVVVARAAAGGAHGAARGRRPPDHPGLAAREAPARPGGALDAARRTARSRAPSSSWPTASPTRPSRRLYRGRMRSEWPALDEAMLTSVDPRAVLAQGQLVPTPTT